MRTKTIGLFEIEIDGGGYGVSHDPDICTLRYNLDANVKVELKFSYIHLRDLMYAVECLIREAERRLPDSCKV